MTKRKIGISSDVINIIDILWTKNISLYIFHIIVSTYNTRTSILLQIKKKQFSLYTFVKNKINLITDWVYFYIYL